MVPRRLGMGSARTGLMEATRGMPARPSGRAADQLRPIELVPGASRHAEGSCLVKCGNTHVLCTASAEARVPGFLKGTGLGWVTAEYGMLPRATHTRGEREAARGKQSGRTQEIQRLIGRSLRAVVDRKAMGELSIVVDCDVLEADGGTRCASITGGFVALALAFRRLRALNAIKADPVRDHVAAVSSGLWEGMAVLDLDYVEDSGAEADANFVMTGEGLIVEAQATAEGRAFSDGEFDALRGLARLGIARLVELQRAALAA